MKKLWKFLLTLAVMAAVAALITMAVTATGWDPRLRINLAKLELAPVATDTDCDQTLRQQLVVQQAATNTQLFNELIDHILSQRQDCRQTGWKPTATDAEQPGMCGSTKPAKRNSVSGANQPTSLLQLIRPPDRRPTFYITQHSRRDGDNNLIIHWTSSAKPADNSNCWLYLAAEHRWTRE